MSFLPRYQSACELAHAIPSDIAELLQLDTDFSKRFREETITDLLVAALKTLPIRGLVLALPDERFTGSDFDITIISNNRKDAVQFRIQAKRLSAHPTSWRTGSYKELSHPHNTGRQASTLVRSSASEKIPTIPLYAFYNPQRVVDQSNSMVAGIELASGCAINHLVRQMVNAKPQRLPYKRIGYLQPLFFPLSKLLCEPFQNGRLGTHDYETPPPEAFRKLVTEEIDSRSDVLSTSHWSAPDVYRLAARGTKDTFEQPEMGVVEATPLGDVTKKHSARDDPLPRVMHMILDQAGGERTVRARIKRPKLIMRSE